MKDTSAVRSPSNMVRSAGRIARREVQSCRPLDDASSPNKPRLYRIIANVRIDRMTQLTELETPALVVDVDIMHANLDRAASYARSHGVALRPHVKTHKSPVIAREQLQRGASGLTCATPHEAEVMSEVCDDLLVMYPPVGASRARRLAEVAQRVRLTVALDSE